MQIKDTAHGEYKRLPADKLKRFQGELKELTVGEYNRLRDSLTDEGFFEPVEYWEEGGEYWIIDGHQRLAIMEREGWTIEGGAVPVRPMLARNKKHAAQRLLLLNSRYGRITGQGFYEYINTFDIDITELDKFSFSDLDLDTWKIEFGDNETIPPDEEGEPTEPPAEPVAVLGDIWELGGHRVICGDAAGIDFGVEITSIITDPPYGVDYIGPGWMAGQKKEAIANDKGVAFEETISEVFANLYAQIKTPSLHWVFTPGGRNISLAVQMAELMRGYTVNNFSVWDKAHLGMGQLLRNQWEGIFLLSVGDGITSIWRGGHSQPNIFQQSDARPQAGDHPTPKPLALIAKLVEMVTSKGDAIAEPFLGSGTTLIAAEQTGRTCYGVEVAPGYIDVTIKRWEAYTGKDAVLADDGRTFAEIAGERLGGDGN